MVVLFPSAAAHAEPIVRTPANGTRLAESPGEVRIRFNEPVDTKTTVLTVFNATLERVDEGATQLLDRDTARVSLRPNLTQSGYTVHWETYSAIDGHLTRGVWVFAVGDAPMPPTPPPPTNPPPWGAILARLLSFVGLALLFGAAAVRACAARGPGGAAPQMGGLALLAALILVAGQVLLLVYQVHGAGSGHADYLTATDYGRGILLRTALALATLVAVDRAVRRAGPAFDWVLWLSASAGAAAHAAYAHAAAFVEPRLAGAAVDLLHLAPALVWSGGLVALTVHLRQASSPSPLAIDALRTLTLRFSRIAAGCIGLLFASGIALALLLVGTPSAWIRALESSYGQVLLFKLFFAVALVGFGVVNHYAYVAKFARGQATETQPLFRANVRREAINALLVIALGALLTNIAPPA